MFFGEFTNKTLSDVTNLGTSANLEGWLRQFLRTSLYQLSDKLTAILVSALLPGQDVAGTNEEP